MPNGKRPGVILYFTLRSGINSLSLEEKGMLLDAIFSYGEDGIAPAFNNPALSIVWGFVQPLLDADEKRYKDRCKKARESIETRWSRVRNDTTVFDSIPSHEAYTSDTNTIQFTSNHSFVPPSAGTKKPRQSFGHDSLPYRAARWLADQIEARLPNCTPHTEATLQNWAADFDKCHRLDRHDWEDINAVLQFSQLDPFWQSNILSGGKFRKQYTQLLAKMGGGGT